MTFTAICEEKLKITLGRQETKRLFGSLSTPDRKDQSTKLAIKFLLKCAVQEHYFRPWGKKVAVDIFRNIYGGFDVYFIVEEEEMDSFSYVLEFPDMASVSGASKIIEGKDLPIVSSGLYKTEQGYRLIIITSKEVLSRLFCISEFYSNIYLSSMERIKTEEYGSPIFTESAVEVLERFY